jgi:predicted house-cleaning noncanonical NTP pyrophosphatase (MazG superfamily)
LPLCDFIQVYFERLSLLDEKESIELYLPSIELLKICIEQIQLCEIDKFRNLNKLAILVNLISSLLRIKFINSSDENILQIKENLASKKLLLQLVKSLVQVI